MKREKGFTMIELVMVIVIIGILAAIAIPRFLDLRANAREAACQQSGGALRAAISNFYASSIINSPTANPWPGGGVAFETDITPYVQAFPVDPLNGEWSDFYIATTGMLSVGGACS